MDMPSKEFHTIPETIFDLYKESGAAEYKHDVIGGVISDTKLSWLALGPYLQVFSTKTVEVKSVWCFGAVVKELHAKVTCVEELKVPYRDVNLLVVGLKYGKHAGMVCIYNLSFAKVLRAIEIPQEVTSLHVISPGNDSTTFPGPLSALDGIISVGTTGGVVYVIDLCKERITESKKIANILDIRNEINPCQLRILTTSDVYDLERHKTHAEQEGTHVAILLNEMETSGKHFELRTPQGRNLILASKEEVQVSTLHYAPQLCSLFVGYNFGALQIWNFLEMRLEYTSPVYEEKIPVSYIAIQEPIDDPRAFCYFWAVYSCKGEYDNVYPLAALYSLSYEVKDYHEGYGYIYRGLHCCSVRFQANLRIADTSHCKSAIGASCIRLQAYNKTNSNINMSCMTSAEDYTLCMMVWNVRCKEHKFHTYMSLFDLNQWYKEQMPDLPHQENYRNYLSHLCLTDFNASREYVILDAYIDPASIDPFIGAQKLEEHYRPSSLAFVITTLTEVEMCRESCLGAQRGFFKTLENSGPLALMHPEELYTHARSLGLSPLFLDMPHETHLQVKCEILLSIALERKMLQWLCKCATSWGNGSHRSAGLSLELLLNWGWERTKQLKNSADRYCSCLFDYSGTKLDNNHHALITACRVQFGNLKDLFSFVVKNCEAFLIHPDITRQQLVWLQKNYAYFNVIGWMINLNLLPESKETYPLEDIQCFYNQRRSYLKSLQSADVTMNCLFIDQLTDIPSLRQEWIEDGAGEYPPTTLQTLLRCYFHEELDIKAAHSVVAYALLDLVVYCEKNDNISATMIKFPQIFDLTLSTTKAIQAFWQFDHAQLETAVSQLSSRMIHPHDLSINQHQFVINMLKLLGQYKLALKYMKARNTKGCKEDVKHLIQLHVRNNMLFEGLSIERRHSDPELLQAFFLECLRADVIMKLVSFNFTKDEELQLLDFMDRYKYDRREDFKTVYFVRRGRFLDFYMRHNKEATNRTALPSVVRNTLDSILPEVTKKVITTCMDLKGLTYNDPKSLSAYVCDSKERAKFSSDFVKACVVNCRGKWHGEEDLFEEDFPFVRPPFVRYKQEGKCVIYTKQVDKISLKVQPDGEDVEEMGPPSKRIRLDTSADLDRTKIETMHYSRNSTINFTNEHRDTVTMTPQSILKTPSQRGESTTPEDNMIMRRSLTPKLSARPLISTPSVRFKVSTDSSNRDNLTTLENNVPKDSSTSDYFTAETASPSMREDKKAAENKRKRKLSTEACAKPEKITDEPSVLRSSSFQYIGNVNATKFLESMRTSYVEEAIPLVNVQDGDQLNCVHNPPPVESDKSAVFVFTGNDLSPFTLSPKARSSYQTHINTYSESVPSSFSKHSSNISRQAINVLQEVTYEKKTITRSMTKEIISRRNDQEVVERETRTINQTTVADSWKEVTMEDPKPTEERSRVVDFAQDEEMDVDFHDNAKNSKSPLKQRTTKELVSHFEDVNSSYGEAEPIKGQKHRGIRTRSQSRSQVEIPSTSNQHARTPSLAEDHLFIKEDVERPGDQYKEEFETPHIEDNQEFDTVDHQHHQEAKSSSKVSEAETLLVKPKSRLKTIKAEVETPPPAFNQNVDISGIFPLANTPADSAENSPLPSSEAISEMSRTVIDITASPMINKSVFERTGFIDYFADTDEHSPVNAQGAHEKVMNPLPRNKRRVFLDLQPKDEKQSEKIDENPKANETLVHNEASVKPQESPPDDVDSNQESLKLAVAGHAEEEIPESSQKAKQVQLMSSTIIEICDSPVINKSIFDRSTFVDYFADTFVSPSDTLQEDVTNENEDVTIDFANKDEVLEIQDSSKNSEDERETSAEEDNDKDDDKDCKTYADLSKVNTSHYTKDPVMNNYNQDQDLVLNEAPKSFLQQEGTLPSDAMPSEPAEELFESIPWLPIEEQDEQSDSDHSELNMAVIEVISISSNSSKQSRKTTTSENSSYRSYTSCSEPADVGFIEDSLTRTKNSDSESEPEPGEIAFIADSTCGIDNSRVNTPKSFRNSEINTADTTVSENTIQECELGFIADSTLNLESKNNSAENLDENVNEVKTTTSSKSEESTVLVEAALPTITEEVPTTPKRKRRSLSRAESPALTIQLRPRRYSITSEPSTTPVKNPIKKEKKPVPKAVSRTRSMCTEMTPQAPPAKKVARARSVDLCLPAIVEESKSTPATEMELMSARRLTRKQKQMISNAPTMDRLQLMDKGDFTGATDPEEDSLLERSPPSSIGSSSAAENARQSQEAAAPFLKRPRGRPRKTPEKEQLDRSSRGGSTESDRVLRKSIRKEMEIIQEEVTSTRGSRRSSSTK